MISDRKLRIAVVIKQFLTTGGAERYALEVTRRLARQHDVHVFAQEWSYQKDEKITFHRIPRPFKKPSWLNQLAFSYFTGKAISKDFDIIHTHEKITRFDLMTIHSPCFRSYITHEKKWWKRSYLWLAAAFSPRNLAWLWLEKKQYSYNANRLFIAVSKLVKRDVQSNYSIPDESFFIACPGVDAKMNVKQFSNDKIKHLRAKHGINEEDLAILFVGTEFERKGLCALLRGFSLVCDSKLKLVVAGGGGGRMSNYVRMARSLKLERHVTFLGLVKKIEEIYAMCDAFILPTLIDPSAMAPIEAMFAGLPTALSRRDYCGAAEHIKNKEALIIDNPQDHREIAKILRMFMDKKFRHKLGKKGQILARALTWDKTTTDTLSCYAEVLKRKYSKLLL